MFCCPDALKLAIPQPKREADSGVSSVPWMMLILEKNMLIAQAHAHVHADEVHDHAGEDKIILKPMLMFMFMFMQEKITWWAS